MYDQVKVMSSHIHYSPLPTNENDVTNLDKFAFPKISRLKCFGILFVIFLSVMLVVISCFSKGYCSNNSMCNAERRENQLDRGQYSKGEHIKFHHMKKRLPQCVIIGARKAGTRALLTYLNIHPGIVVKGAEMHFFDDDEFDNDLESYRKQMPYSYPDQITIEKTPAYFTEEEVPERIYRMNKTIKLLLILRDPVERTISDYLQIAEGKKAKNKYFAPFEEHVLDSKGNINRSYKAVRSSIYHKHLSHWLEYFSLDQIFIIESKDLVENPAVVMYDVEDFLQIEHKIKPSNFYFNKTKGFYCIKTDTIQKCLADSKGRQHPHVEASVLSKLRRFFAPHNRKLYKIISTDFHWPEE